MRVCLNRRTQILPEISGDDDGDGDGDGDHPEFRTTTTSVSVSGSPVHAAVTSSAGRSAASLLLALPAHKCDSLARAAALSASAARALALRHGSLAGAFVNREALDEMFGGMLLEELLDVRTVEQVGRER